MEIVYNYWKFLNLIYLIYPIGPSWKVIMSSNITIFCYVYNSFWRTNPKLNTGILGPYTRNSSKFDPF